MSPNAFKAVIDIDLLGTFNMCRASFEALKHTKGTIVNISATLHYGAVSFVGHAAAAKAAIDSLTRSLALEWGEFGIRVNAVAPGWVEETEGFDRLIGDHADSFAQTIPIGRACTKRDIALSVLYLVSSAAATVTGAVLVVDGGNWLWRPKLISGTSGHKETPKASSSHFKPTYKL
jgi:peroxisomal 2,4-dienoyl-CoA reductase